MTCFQQIEHGQCVGISFLRFSNIKTGTLLSCLILIPLLAVSPLDLPWEKALESASWKFTYAGLHQLLQTLLALSHYWSGQTYSSFGCSQIILRCFPELWAIVGFSCFQIHQTSFCFFYFFLQDQYHVGLMAIGGLLPPTCILTMDTLSLSFLVTIVYKFLVFYLVAWESWQIQKLWCFKCYQQSRILYSFYLLI